MIKNPDLMKQIILRFGSGIIVLGLMFFLPAGSFGFWPAWIFCAVLFIPMLIALPFLYLKDPELIARRMKYKEKEPEQKKIIKFSSMFYLIGYIIPGLDFRFGWSNVPAPLIILSNIIIFWGYLFFLSVLKENSYAARTIEVEPGQKVISTGPYALVRHPMYLAVVIMIIFSPTALASYWALPFFLPVFPFLIMRISNEEEVLKRDLPGYSEYCQKTRYRLVPFIW